METLTKPFLAKVVASSTSSGDVLFPLENPPPWIHTMAGRDSTESPAGSYTSSFTRT